MQFSEMFGKTPATPASQTPKKALESREEHGVLPVTAKLLADNVAALSKTSITLYGLPANRVVMVGKVESAEESGTHSAYTVDDETGSVLVKNYQDFIEVKPTKGDYVRLVGEVRAEAGEVALSAINMTVLPEAEAPAAMGFHRIQVVVAECHVAKTSPKMELFTPEKTEVKAEAKVEVKAERPSPVKSKPAASEDIPQAIVDFLEKINGNADHPGTTHAELAKELSLSLADVKKATEGLLDDGTLYTTIDDDHLKIVD
jgi:hypothetical protein